LRENTMNATTITTFYGARDGELYPTRFEPGDLIEGELAEIAVREKWAEETALEPDERPNSPRRKPPPR
jgi:hypothetical protein